MDPSYSFCRRAGRFRDSPVAHVRRDAMIRSARRSACDGDGPFPGASRRPGRT